MAELEKKVFNQQQEIHLKHNLAELQHKRLNDLKT